MKPTFARRDLSRLHGTFGSDAFGKKAESFARFFGTPTFLIVQTAVVVLWIVINVAAVSLQWDPYPFILLNLAFSLQAAYAAPLILLAQTRQADRDKAMSETDAEHREALAAANEERQTLAMDLWQNMSRILEENMRLTEEVNALTAEIHSRLIPA
ncbi:MAG: DUF1003 domain-containing protein [Acidimicrobiia bacterium]